jgi:putative endonuclease
MTNKIMENQPPDIDRFARWPLWRRWFGFRSERFAARFLRTLGYRILGRNVADLRGEIDLLALDGQTLVVVEVRSTESDDFQKVAASVDREKQRRLTNAILRFLKRRKLLDTAVRFDVLAICWPADGREPAIRHYRHAFQAVGRFQMYS